jgi:hypothetical protein
MKPVHGSCAIVSKEIHYLTIYTSGGDNKISKGFHYTFILGF